MSQQLCTKITKAEAKQQIYKLISREKGGVSVGQIQSVAGCSGSSELHKNNLCTAFGISDEAGNAIIELLEAKEIDVEPVDLFVTLWDGMGMPPYPVATADGVKRGYNTPHYLPVLYTLYPSPTRQKLLKKANKTKHRSKRSR